MEQNSFRIGLALTHFIVPCGRTRRSHEAIFMGREVMTRFHMKCGSEKMGKPVTHWKAACTSKPMLNTSIGSDSNMVQRCVFASTTHHDGNNCLQFLASTLGIAKKEKG